MLKIYYDVDNPSSLVKSLDLGYSIDYFFAKIKGL